MQAPPPAYPVGQTPAGSNPRTYFTFWSVLFGTLILAWVFSVAASVADVVAASSTTGVPFGDSAYCGSTDREIFGSTVCDLYDAAEGFQFFSTILASVLLVLVFAAASMTAPGTGKLALAAGIGLALFSVVQLIAFSLMLAFVEELEKSGNSVFGSSLDLSPGPAVALAIVAWIFGTAGAISTLALLRRATTDQDGPFRKCCCNTRGAKAGTRAPAPVNPPGYPVAGTV